MDARHVIILTAVSEKAFDHTGETEMAQFNHFDQAGNAIMVDVSEKNITAREASATGVIRVNKEILDAVLNKTVKKGDVLGVARVAGIMAAKRTWELIPMCHPLAITKCAVDFDVSEEDGFIRATSFVKIESKTGVEMEALTAVSVALLTIYDMCKAIDKRMEISGIHLVRKTGGKSGDFTYER